MQAAGCDQRCGKRQRRGERGMQPEAKRNPIDDRAHAADDRADDRERPTRAPHIFTLDGGGMGKWQACAEGDADLEVGSKPVEQRVRYLHFCIPSLHPYRLRLGKFARQTHT